MRNRPELFCDELKNFYADQSRRCADILKLGFNSGEYTFVSINNRISVLILSVVWA